MTRTDFVWFHKFGINTSDGMTLLKSHWINFNKWSRVGHNGTQINTGFSKTIFVVGRRVKLKIWNYFANHVCNFGFWPHWLELISLISNNFGRSFREVGIPLSNYSFSLQLERHPKSYLMTQCKYLQPVSIRTCSESIVK